MGKKYIRKVNNIGTDPLKVIPEDVYEHVFQYLSTSDLLRSSLVSKAWYHKIGKCNKFKKQIRLKYSRRNHEDEIKFIKKSCREYSDIVINLPDLANKRIKYEKNIRLILEKFSNSVTSIDTTHDVQRISDLPNLKNVTLRANTLFSKGITSKMKFVEKLKLSYLSRLGSIVMERAFLNMVNLKSLESKICFFKPIEAYNFSLKEAIFYGYDNRKDGFNFSFFKFALAQKFTLEVLVIAEPITISHCMSILENFPKLHTLGINVDLYHDRSNLNTLTEAGLDVIPLLRNLKVLRVFILNSSVLDAVALSSSITRVEYLLYCLEFEEEDFVDGPIEFVRCDTMYSDIGFRC